MNPHQITAALFPFQSQRLDTGALLADEVGLGKTVEAGLVIGHLRPSKCRVLCIVPAPIRRQWQQELAEKFDIDSVILDAGSYGAAAKGTTNPFDQNGNASSARTTSRSTATAGSRQ